MKNSTDSIGNRARDHPVCSAVPHPLSTLRTPNIIVNKTVTILELKKVLDYRISSRNCFNYSACKAGGIFHCLITDINSFYRVRERTIFYLNL